MFLPKVRQSPSSYLCQVSVSQVASRRAVCTGHRFGGIVHGEHGVGLLLDAAVLCRVHWNIESRLYEVEQCLCEGPSGTFVVAVVFVCFRLFECITAVRITIVTFYRWLVVSFISTAFSALAPGEAMGEDLDKRSTRMLLRDDATR